MINHIYTSLTRLSWPILRILPHIRARQNKELNTRINERFGQSSIQKTSSKIIWIHGASNGEILSALPLVDYLINLPSKPTILMTTMTVTGANLVSKRTDPERVIHQFIPYDYPEWISRFHKNWAPDMVIWIESELWPNHLKYIRKNNIPAVLLNARLSDKSVRNWKKVQTSFHQMMSAFQIILAQTERDKTNLNMLGINHVLVESNLKDLSLPLPVDNYALKDLQSCKGNRPILLYGSTHDPEEKMAYDIHQKLKISFPSLLTIIVPRHPKRGENIATALNKEGASIALRSLKMSPRTNTDFYIADTLGELGLFYSLSDIVFVGNSMGCNPGGGHNLLEPAWFNCAIVSGDSLHNFSVQAQEMPAVNACRIVSSNEELYETFKVLLTNKNIQATLAHNAYTYVKDKQAIGLQHITNAIEPSCKKAGLL